MFKELRELIELFRSLAENDPLNLLKFSDAKKVYDIVGEKAFIEHVNNVLDLTE